MRSLHYDFADVDNFRICAAREGGALLLLPGEERPDADHDADRRDRPAGSLRLRGLESFNFRIWNVDDLHTSRGSFSPVSKQIFCKQILIL